ncbi:LTA synthase family protein [Robertmurraya sp. Marseille-Q9965]
MRDKIKKLFIEVILIIVQTFVTVFIVEVFYRNEISEAVQFLGDSTRRFFYNFILVFLLFSGLKIFNRKLFIVISFIVTIPLLILGFGSNIKQEIRGEPIIPTDLLLGNEARNMLDFFSASLLIWLIVIAVVGLLSIGYLVFKVPNEKNRKAYQLYIPGIILVLFGLFVYFESNNQESLLKRDLMIENFPLDPQLTYKQNGVIAGFFMNLDALRSIEPSNYSEETINNLLKEIPNIEYSDQDEKPDIIVIMNEAFWDPTVLDGVNFNSDPLPFFRELSNDHTSGSLLVPVFGGQTVNTEFEALTGMSTQILPYGSIPYISYITRPVSSLPSILKSEGYENTMIHTYHNWFYQRNEVMGYLGFDQFVPIEFIENPILTPTFYKDKTITDEILKKIKQDSGGPNFIFAVTTQNHGPYPAADEDKLENASISVELAGKEKFTETAENQLEYYSDNLVEIDLEIRRLVEVLEKRDKKTILVFFGDHLPLLGDNYQVYREAGYYNDDGSLEEYMRMHTTPFFIWDNFSQKNEKLTISSTMLAPLVLERAELEGNPLTSFLLDQYQQNEISIIPKKEYWDDVNLNYKTMQNYELLQYDLLLGDMYGLKDSQTISSNKNYRLGYDNPKISKVVKQQVNGEKALLITGDYFTGVSNVFVNGEKVNKISTTVNEIIIPYVDSEDALKIQIKIHDSKENMLAESNVYEYKN